MTSKVNLLLIIFTFSIKIVTSQIGERCSPTHYSDYPLYMEHPNNCSKYLACGNGIWLEMECPARLHFNAERQVCDWPSEAHCKTRYINSHQVIHALDAQLPPYVTGAECNPSIERNEPRVAPHSSDCSKFLICNRQWIEMECPGDLLFSIETRHCEYAKNAKCCATCEVTKKECTNDGNRLVHPDDCRSYFECLNGKLVEMKCSENQHYDPIKGCCIEGICANEFSTTTATDNQPKVPLPDCPIDGFLFPNYQNCSKFFICNGGTLVDQSCPPSTLFSIYHNNCEDKDLAVCA